SPKRRAAGRLGDGDARLPRAPRSRGGEGELRSRDSWLAGRGRMVAESATRLRRRGMGARILELTRRRRWRSGFEREGRKAGEPMLAHILARNVRKARRDMRRRRPHGEIAARVALLH